MVLCQKLLLSLKPRVDILVTLQNNRLVKTLGETLQEGAQLLPSVLAANTQLFEK